MASKGMEHGGGGPYGCNGGYDSVAMVAGKTVKRCGLVIVYTVKDPRNMPTEPAKGVTFYFAGIFCWYFRFLKITIYFIQYS